MGSTGNTYFDGYGDLAVQTTMLSDAPRMRAYHTAIVNARDYFEGSTVLDVGAGTGVLSMWVAKETAARRVVAVEANAAMAARCTALVAANGLSDRVEVVHSTVEALELAEGSVDIIVSEWMGHYLLHEGMLDSVLFARDKFLRAGAAAAPLPALREWRLKQTQGLLFPWRATIFAEFSFVRNVELSGWAPELFGLNIDAVFCPETPGSRAPGEPLVRHISSRPDWSGKESKICELDLRTCEAPLEVRAEEVRADFAGAGTTNCLAISFSCEFPEGTVLDTRPGQPETHWKQTLVMLPGVFPVEPSLDLRFELRIARESRAERQYEIELSML